MAEGAPLLREYRVKSSIEGSNPSLSARYENGTERSLFCIWRRERWCRKTLWVGYGRSALSPSGHRLRRCSLGHPASAVAKFVWNEFGRPQDRPWSEQVESHGRSAQCLRHATELSESARFQTLEGSAPRRAGVSPIADANNPKRVMPMAVPALE